MGEGKALGIGTVRISWYDNNNNLHIFDLSGTLHIPSSPVNIIGIPALSKIIGDFDRKGTRIDSSGLDSVLTWNDRRFVKSFQHPASSLPEMALNDGFSAFHSCYNIVDRLLPKLQSCYKISTHRAPILKRVPSVHPLYNEGEEITYKNNNHIEKGIIDKITFDTKCMDHKYIIKFKDNRMQECFRHNIQSSDDTDLASTLSTVDDYEKAALHLTDDDILQLKNPTPLTSLQQQWVHLHHQLGHLPYAAMDDLVMRGKLPVKFSKLKGKPIICPSCTFGRMRKRQWRFRGA